MFDHVVHQKIAASPSCASFKQSLYDLWNFTKTYSVSFEVMDEDVRNYLSQNFGYDAELPRLCKNSNGVHYLDHHRIMAAIRLEINIEVDLFDLGRFTCNIVN